MTSEFLLSSATLRTQEPAPGKDSDDDVGRRMAKNVAKRRWRLLARALTRLPDPPDEESFAVEEDISVRRFTCFELLRPILLETETDRTWWLYTALLERGQRYVEVLVRRASKSFTADELIGFNNTGNVCVWPSEECLAYYLIKNQKVCQGRRILELGGGMSCLAGLLAAKYCEPSCTTLTDGNMRSVENVRRIVEKNHMAESVRCAVVQWARAAKVFQQSCHRPQDSNGDDLYELILCADCLFFDDARLDLVDTIYGFLADDGVALAMAPRRGSTFRKFADAAIQRGFVVRQNERADYWKSQTRKFCDYCKCWIADNRPSIEFHENGKKHKENVAKRLRDIQKNSAKQAKQQKKYENDLQKMEQAAMAAYLKDVEGNTRDISANIIIDQKSNRIIQKEERGNPNQIPDAAPDTHPRFHGTSYRDDFGEADIDPFDPYAKQKLARLEARKSRANKEVKKSTKEKLEKKKHETSQKTLENDNSQAGPSKSKLPIRKVWCEALSQGYSYYWNIETNETVWEPPVEGFMTLAEQAKEAKEQILQQQLLDQMDQEESIKNKDNLEEQRANVEREKLKEIRKRHEEKRKKGVEEENEEEEAKIYYRKDYSIPEKSQPYGTWKIVERPIIDLQLPKVETSIIPIIAHIKEPLSRREFKEKVITKISDGLSDDEESMVQFKKRKFGSKNARKRLDDD